VKTTVTLNPDLSKRVESEGTQGNDKGSIGFGSEWPDLGGTHRSSERRCTILGGQIRRRTNHSEWFVPKGVISSSSGSRIRISLGNR
jgi:hypothetical protein